MTIEELGQKTKAKYPQYQGLSDTEVGQKVLEKYPDYQSQITGQTGPSVGEQAGGLLAKLSPTLANLGLITSIPKLTEQTAKTNLETEQLLGLIRRARATQDPAEAERLRQEASQLGGESDALQQQIETTQRLGNVTERDLERSNRDFALRRGLAQMGEQFSYLAPYAQLGRLAPVGTAATQTASQFLRAVPGIATPTQRITGAGLAGMLPGIGTGVTKAALTAEDLVEGVQDIAEGGIIGGATGTIFQSAGEFANWIKNRSQNLPNKVRNAARDVYKTTLKDNVKDKTFYKQAGGKDAIIDDSIKLNVPGTKEGVKRELEKYGPEFGEIVDGVMKESDKAGQKASVKQMLLKVKKETLKALNNPETRTQYKAAEAYFDDALAQYTDDMTWSATTALRKRLDKQVGAQILTEESQGKKFAMKKFATAIRKESAKTFPELAEPTRRYQLLAGLSDAFRKEPVFGLPEITSTAIGATVSGGPGGLTGLIGGMLARSPGVKRFGATQVLKRIPETIAKQGPQNIAKTGGEQIVPIVGAIQRALQKETNKKKEQRVLP